jgi:phosphoglycolate phosphatase-like HAD superfamily hydrolase
MKALIFDLDGTLLNSEKRIGNLTRQALLDCHEAGYRLILATSRPIRAVRQFVEPEILDLCLSITRLAMHVSARFAICLQEHGLSQGFK